MSLRFPGGHMSGPSPRADDLERLERDAVGYFLRAANPENGLVADSSRPGSPCSIAATGLGLAVSVVGTECGFLPRRDAVERTLAALRFFREVRRARRRMPPAIAASTITSSICRRAGGPGTASSR